MLAWVPAEALALAWEVALGGGCRVWGLGTPNTALAQASALAWVPAEALALAWEVARVAKVARVARVAASHERRSRCSQCPWSTMRMPSQDLHLGRFRRTRSGRSRCTAHQVAKVVLALVVVRVWALGTPNTALAWASTPASSIRRSTFVDLVDPKASALAWVPAWALALAWA